MSEHKGAAVVEYEKAIVSTCLCDAADRTHKYAKDAVNSFAEGEEHRMILLGLKRFTKAAPFNRKAAKRFIADKILADNTYKL